MFNTFNTALNRHYKKLLLALSPQQSILIDSLKFSHSVSAYVRLLMLPGGSSHNLCTESNEYVQIGKVVVSHLHRCFQISLGEFVSWISSVFCDKYVKGDHIRQAQHARFARFPSVWSSYTPFELFCISHYYKFNLSFLSSLDACLVLPFNLD